MPCPARKFRMCFGNTSRDRDLNQGHAPRAERDRSPVAARSRHSGIENHDALEHTLVLRTLSARAPRACLPTRHAPRSAEPPLGMDGDAEQCSALRFMESVEQPSSALHRFRFSFFVANRPIQQRSAKAAEDTHSTLMDSTALSLQAGSPDPAYGMCVGS